MFFSETETTQSSSIFFQQNYFDPWDPIAIDPIEGNSIDKHIIVDDVKMEASTSDKFLQNPSISDLEFAPKSSEIFSPTLPNEFLQFKAYATQIILTNTTNSEQKINILAQIPVGSVPMYNGSRTIGKHVQVNPGESKVMFYYYYFPKTGKFKHFPVQVCVF